MTKGRRVDVPGTQELTMLDTGARAVIGWSNDTKAQVDDLEVYLEQDGRILTWSKEQRQDDPEEVLSSNLCA